MLESDVDNLPRPSAEGLEPLLHIMKLVKISSLLAQSIPDNLEGIKVSVDAANGATSALMP